MNQKILDTIFNDLREEQYCIVRHDASKAIAVGMDIDLYCHDIGSVGKKILNVGNKLLDDNTFEAIKVIEDRKGRHVYIDFYKDSKLNFRFDLYGKLPSFLHIEVKKELFKRCLDQRIEKNGKYFPDLASDLVVRYVEYIENYPEVATKIKHLEYISSTLSTSGVQDVKAFLEVLSEYVVHKEPKRENKTDYLKPIKTFFFRLKRKTKHILGIHA